MEDVEFRRFARNGALEMCRRAVSDGHFTTRQNIQYNWPKLEETPDILAELNAAAAPRRIVNDEPAPKRNGWTAAKRKAHSAMMKKRWAAKKRGK